MMAKSGGKSPRPSTGGGAAGAGGAAAPARGNHDNNRINNYGPGSAGTGGGNGGGGEGGSDRRIDRSSSSDRGGGGAGASGAGSNYNGQAPAAGLELKGLARGAGRGLQQTRPAWMTDDAAAAGLGAPSSSSFVDRDSRGYGDSNGYDAGAFPAPVPGQFDAYPVQPSPVPYGDPMIDLYPPAGVAVIHSAYPISMQQQQHIASSQRPPPVPIQPPPLPSSSFSSSSSSSSYLPPNDNGGFLQQIQLLGAKTAAAARDPRLPPGQGLALGSGPAPGLGLGLASGSGLALGPGPAPGQGLAQRPLQSAAAGTSVVETLEEKRARLAKNMKKPKGR